MRSPSIGRACLVKQFVILIVVFHCFYLTATDSIRREIRCEKGTVWVEDNLHVSADFAVSNNELSNVFDAAKDQTTNLVQSIKVLLQSENLELRDYDAKCKNQTLDLRMLSKITFPQPEKPAILNWVSTFGGNRPGLSSGDPKRNEAVMLVFSKDGQYTLLVPSLLREDATMQELEKHHLTYDRFFTRNEPLRFESVLKSGEDTQPLLSWNVGTQTTNGPSAALIQQMDQIHKLSGNDQLSLATALKIVRAGYYNILPISKVKK